jgi:acetaldehyde dehydrogenase / alcohol dehydrogenase
VTELAAPVGVVVGLIPVTNPIATAIYKTLIALKGRNSLILSFHRVCLPLAAEFTDAVVEVLEGHGAPTELVQSVRVRSSRDRTARLMAHDDVAFVLATGGPGNAPAWIAADADLDHAAHSIVASKSFDHGLICGAEHNLVVDATVESAFNAALEAAGAAVLNADEAARFREAAFTDNGGGFRPELMGQAANTIAAFLDIRREHPIKVLVVPGEPDLDSPLTSEKMGPFLSSFTVQGDDEALTLARALLAKMGTGHTAIVHTADDDRANRFADLMPASRVLVNSPGSQGVCGLTSGLPPAFTLGCGTFGGTSTTDNISWHHLTNTKRLATYRPLAVSEPVA